MTKQGINFPNFVILTLKGFFCHPELACPAEALAKEGFRIHPFITQRPFEHSQYVWSDQSARRHVSYY